MSTLREIRENLLVLTEEANANFVRRAEINDATEKVISSLSEREIIGLVRSIRLDIMSILVEIKVHEEGIAKLNAQLAIIQDHCPHPDEESDAEGSIEIRTCKICGHSRTLDYGTAKFYR